ncbi:AAA family ATPase, partial [Spirosoma jeollabukense]
MLINSLALRNFKCLEELDVKFAPITLLTGANSSGKSSLINAILAVLQTEQFPLYLSPNGKYVDMGSMKEVTFKNDLSKSISIDIAFDLSKDKLFSFNFLHENFFKTTWSVNKRSKLPKLKAVNSIAGNIEISICERDSHVSVDILDKGFGDFETSEEQYSAIHSEFERILKERVGYNQSIHNKIIKITDIQYKSIEDLAHQLNYLSSAFFFDQNINDQIFRYTKSVDNAFNYIGSFRKPPGRTYNQKAKSQRKVDSDGEGYIDQLIEWQETDENKLDSLIAEVSLLGIFNNLKPKRLQGGRFELNVKTSKNSRWASLEFVGELIRTGSRVNFVSTKKQSNDQAVATTDR